MNFDEIVAGLMLELRRGTLIMLVLEALKQPKYGYSLVKQLEDSDVRVEANTLYPLMRRLEGQGLLISEWETSGAKPRKYYKTTPDGIEVLSRAKTQWQTFASSVNNFLEDRI